MNVHLEEPLICQLCLAGGAGMGCICEDCEDRYNAAIARVAELEGALAIAWDALDDAWTENCPEEVAIVRKALFPKP